MIWNLLFEFFVKYIFGGVLIVNDERVVYSAILGGMYNKTSERWLEQDTTVIDSALTMGTNFNWQMPLGNWLSATATIIVMCLLVYVFFKISIWLFKQGANLFKW